jgi:hypothetical protein
MTLNGLRAKIRPIISMDLENYLSNYEYFQDDVPERERKIAGTRCQ